MDHTPTRASRLRSAEVQILDQENQDVRDSFKTARIRKPPPVTPRRFNKFFTPRPRTAAQAVRTSRHALKTIASSALNSRRAVAILPDISEGYLSANENQNQRKKRKYSFISSSTNSTPQSRFVSFLPSSQDALPSSPLRYRQDEVDGNVFDDDDNSDASTEIDEAAWSQEEDDLPTGPRIVPYVGTSTSRSILARRLKGPRRLHVAETSSLWQAEAANFFSDAEDINADLQTRQPPIIPFSMSACHTNPLVATADEEGIIRFLDPSDGSRGIGGIGRTILSIQPHDNAIMDLAFSSDDNRIATASGDQTCQVIDVQAQRSLFSLRAHTASVKKIQFQPGSGNNVLASAGRDGTICLWDLRIKGQALGSGRRARMHVTDMAGEVTILAPVLEIHDAHNPNAKAKTTSQKLKQSNIAGRNDFSITSLTFLDQSRSNLLATASEVDTVIKLWDLRQSQVSARKKGHTQLPVSVTEEPRSHEHHRKFGINSVALSTDSSRLFALSRDHTVYAYSTSHLILGCSPELTPSSSASRRILAPNRSESKTGLGPLYGLRHPSLRVATFWPRLAIRRSNDQNSELLAVGSTDDCAILFPTSEKYHTASTRTVPTLHDPTSHTTSFSPRRSSRPGLTRNPTSSFTTLFTKSRADEDALPIYYHGTPLVHGHSKEVTSIAWSQGGNLVTASDDFTIRCWREDAKEARKIRALNMKGQRDAAALLRRGWADVGVEGWDEDD